MITIDDKDYYSVKELIAKLKLTKKTILRHINMGKLKARKLGNRWIISQSELNDYLKPKN